MQESQERFKRRPLLLGIMPSIVAMSLAALSRPPRRPEQMPLPATTPGPRIGVSLHRAHGVPQSVGEIHGNGKRAKRRRHLKISTATIAPSEGVTTARGTGGG